MRKPEILAPAGSPEALLAALRCGADAVYVGGKQFSARQNATNFDLQALKEAAALCHLYGAQLHLTVNTILLEEELPAFAAYIQKIAACGVDACIVQDVGAAACLHQIVPEMPLHASTQMTIHTPEGALWAKEHGFSRVVVARELSRQEIQPIVACGLEVEQFVHGALCMSVSGQCYLSAMIGSRSANRGLCAQACRLPFSACGNRNACALSLKDLSLVQHMQTLMADGITSLKIEGRMKRPEYVAAAVTALVAAREGKQPDLDTLRAVFSRSGFTDGYYTGQRSDLFGVREKEDVTAAQAVLPALRQRYQKPSHPIALDLHVTVEGGAAVTVTAVDEDGHTCTVYGEPPQPARVKATDAQQIQRQMGKLGDTVYHLRNLTAQCDGTHMLPASALNQMRRTCLQQLDAIRIAANTPTYACHAWDDAAFLVAMPTWRTDTPMRRIRVRTKEQLHALTQHRQPEEIRIVPLSLALDTPCSDTRDLIQPPRWTQSEQQLVLQLQQLRQMGWQHLLCENPAHIRIGTSLGFVLHGGMDLHTVNGLSAAVYQRDGLVDLLLSPELTRKQIAALHTTLPVGVYAYGKLPVMLMRSCPIRQEVGCKSCTGHLIDRTKRQFPVLCHEKNSTELCNAVPVWMADRLEELSCADFLLLDMTDESPSEMLRILQAYRTGTTEKPAHITRGLLYRGISHTASS